MTITPTDDRLPSNVRFGALDYYRRHAGTIARDLCPLLDLEWTGLRQFVDDTQKLVSEFHGGLGRESIDDQSDYVARVLGRRDDICDVLSRMELFDACHLPAGHYTEFWFNGAKFPGMVLRAKLILRELDRSNVRAKVLNCVTGQRPYMAFDPDGKVFDGPLVDLYQMAIEAGVDKHFYVQDQMARPVPFPTEAELWILAFLIATGGQLTFDADSLEAADPAFEIEDFEPKRAWASLVLRLADDTEIKVINCPAVDRGPDRAPSPTSVSTARHRLEHYPIVEGASVVVVQGPTHWPRIIGETEKELHQSDPSITVYGLTREVTYKEVMLGLWLNALVEVFRITRNAMWELDALIEQYAS